MRGYVIVGLGWQQLQYSVGNAISEHHREVLKYLSATLGKEFLTKWCSELKNISWLHIIYL